MDWKREIELLRKKQINEDGTPEPYGNMICDDLQEVMEVVEKQGHSGTSYSLLSKYLKRLVLDKPIFPLTDDPSEWGTGLETKENDSIQNNRYSALFKEPDGTYSDVDRVVFVDTYDGRNSTWSSGVARALIDKMYPIKLPYMPTDKPYYVYGKTMYLGKNGEDLTFDNWGSYNYQVAHYIITPKGERVELDNLVLLDEREEEEKINEEVKQNEL